MAGGFDSGFDSGFDIHIDGASGPTTLGTSRDAPMDSWRRLPCLGNVLDSTSRRYAELVSAAVNISRDVTGAAK